LSNIIEYLGSSQPIKKDDGTWYNNIVDEDGEVLRQIEGETYNDVMKQMKGIKTKAHADIKKQKKDAIRKEATELESMINSTSEIDNYLLGDHKESPTNVDKIEHIDEQLAVKKQEFKTQFDKLDKESKAEAQNLLMSIVTLYFKKGLIDDNEYLKHKMNIETKSLSALVFQLEQAKRVIYQLTEQLHLNLIPVGSIPRTVEVMNGLQRTVLDISKYQHEFVRDIEKQIREFKNEMAEEGKINETVGDNQETEQLTEITLISTTDKKRLLEDMKSFLMEHREDLQVHKSKNVKLNGAEDIPFVDSQDEKVYLDEDVNDEADGNEMHGLQTFGK